MEKRKVCKVYKVYKVHKVTGVLRTVFIDSFAVINKAVNEPYELYKPYELSTPLLSIHISGTCLGGRHDLDVVQTNMCRTGDGKDDGVGDVFSRERDDPFVNIIGSLLVTLVTNNGEFGFYHAGAMLVTLMLCFSMSIRMALERASTACLVAQ